MHITEQDLESLVRDTWAPTVDVAVAVAGPTTAVQDPTLAAQVALSGAWCGTVTVRASRAAISAVAARMFGLAPDELADDDLVDAAGEMANVMAGNVKPFAGGACDMSLPRSGPALDQPGRPVASLGFTIEGHAALLDVRAA